MKTVLIINAHLRYPGFSEGKLNGALVETAKEFFEGHGCEVKTTSIEQGYDPAEEVEKHLWADLIVLQTPVNWFSAPWIYKKYVDEVFNTGLFSQKMLIDDGRTRKDPKKQYGTGGLLKGKKFMLSATWNAPEEAFNDKSQVLFGGKAQRHVFWNVSLNYSFCGMDILPDYACFDVIKNPRFEKYVEDYKKHLAELM